MDSARLQQIQDLYHSARECESGERVAFLSEACRGDGELRLEVHFRKPRPGLIYYFDSASVAKRYLNDPDSELVCDLVRTPFPLFLSALCIAEVTCAIHPRYRERSLAGSVFIRAGDAIHLIAARTAGFREVWTNDRHMLEAARYFRIDSRSA